MVSRVVLDDCVKYDDSHCLNDPDLVKSKLLREKLDEVVDRYEQVVLHKVLFFILIWHFAHFLQSNANDQLLKIGYFLKEFFWNGLSFLWGDLTDQLAVLLNKILYKCDESILYRQHSGIKLQMNFPLIFERVLTQVSQRILGINGTLLIHFFRLMTWSVFLLISLTVNWLNVKLSVKWAHFMLIVSFHISEIDLFLLLFGFRRRFG